MILHLYAKSSIYMQPPPGPLSRDGGRRRGTILIPCPPLGGGLGTWTWAAMQSAYLIQRFADRQQLAGLLAAPRAPPPRPPA